jgi:hypothetical protein
MGGGQEMGEATTYGLMITFPLFCPLPTKVERFT